MSPRLNHDADQWMVGQDRSFRRGDRAINVEVSGLFNRCAAARSVNVAVRYLESFFSPVLHLYCKWRSYGKSVFLFCHLMPYMEL
jgi:hypothetical protein